MELWLIITIAVVATILICVIIFSYIYWNDIVLFFANLFQDNDSNDSQSITSSNTMIN